MKIQLVRATVNDVKLIWKMQVEAFLPLLCKYQDMDTNPANEPVEKVLKRLEQSETYFYLIRADENTVGAIRVIDRRTGRKRISPLFVLPEFQNRGVAQKAILEVEKLHGDKNWELDTILEEKGNCYLYEKMGYRKTGETKKVNDKLTLVFYEK